MNRSKITLEQICSVENCKAAIIGASKHKRKRLTVRKTLEDLDRHAQMLSDFLRDPEAQFHIGERAVINEGTSKKRREITKPRFFPDHCAHWAVIQLVGPVLTGSFYKYSCASIKGRGVHYAKQAVERALKDERGTKYCLQIDVKSFYASIDKEILIGLFARKFKDPRVVNLLAKIVNSYPDAGLPIGYYSSATFANFYLTDCDRYIKETLKIRHYVRYMDDMVLYGSNKRRLHECKDLICEYFAKTRGLKLKRNWQVYKLPYDNKRGKVTKQRATDFVGFKFYRYKTTIRKAIFLRLLRAVRKLQRKKYTVTAARTFMSYNGYLQHTDSQKVREKYIKGKIKISKLKELIRNESRKNNPVNNHPAAA